MLDLTSISVSNLDLVLGGEDIEELEPDLEDCSDCAGCTPRIQTAVRRHTRGRGERGW
jgi:hypothetical protein